VPRKTEEDAERHLMERPPTEEIKLAISTLRFGESPRFVPEDLEHARTLAAVASKALPPVLVRAQTMTVIDGRHLVLAARLRGESAIRVQLFHGNKDEAFLLAVSLNTTHGKPLSLAERVRAASRILESQPHLSDREIAGICRLSPRTVTRQRKTAVSAKQNRHGEADRKRPLTSKVARDQAAELMRAFPGQSNRKIGSEVGLSESTIRDVRHQMDRDDSAST